MTHAACLDSETGALIVQAVLDDLAGMALHFKTNRSRVTTASGTVGAEQAIGHGAGSEALTPTPSAD